MQKDTVVNGLYTVLLDPALENEVVSIENIVKTTLETADGQSIVINGYIDIGIADTMKDLFVNFIGAIAFCIFGYIYVTKRGKRASRIVAGFVPKVVSSDEKESLDEDNGE